MIRTTSTTLSLSSALQRPFSSLFAAVRRLIRRRRARAIVRARLRQIQPELWTERLLAMGDEATQDAIRMRRALLVVAEAFPDSHPPFRRTLVRAILAIEDVPSLTPFFIRVRAAYWGTIRVDEARQ